MATRQTSPTQQRPFAVNAAVCCLLALFAAPAFAVTSTGVPCTKSKETTLNEQVLELAAREVSSEVSIIRDVGPRIKESPSSLTLLAPRAEAAIRKAFKRTEQASIEPAKLTPPMAGIETSQEHTTVKPDESEPEPGIHTRLPGVSDIDLSRYRKQMYRRDI